MQLYLGSAEDFIKDSVQNEVAKKLGDSFDEYYRFRANVSEFNSWQNSLRALSSQLMYADLRQAGVILNMQLPMSSSRLDCFLFGKDARQSDGAVIIELKQWTYAHESDFDECVISTVGRRERALAHPSRQALNYAMYVADTNEALADPSPPIALHACSWLHNMAADSTTALRAEKFLGLLAEAPLFVASDAESRLPTSSPNASVMGPASPSWSGSQPGSTHQASDSMEHTHRMIAGEPAYVLIDDQIVAYEAVLALVRRAQRRFRLKAWSSSAVAQVPGSWRWRST